MIAGIDFDAEVKTAEGLQFRPLSSVTGKPIQPPKDNQIVLNQWAAEDLGLSVGDQVTVSYFEPETTHRSQIERTHEFEIADIAAVTTPASPFGYNRRDGVTPATYSGGTHGGQRS